MIVPGGKKKEEEEIDWNKYNPDSEDEELFREFAANTARVEEIEEALAKLRREEADRQSSSR